MTIYDVIKQRGLKASFGNSYLNPDNYEGVETVVFITEDDTERLRGYHRDNTYIIVSHNRKESLEKFNQVKDFVNILFCMSKVVFSRGDMRIRIEKFRPSNES